MRKRIAILSALMLAIILLVTGCAGSYTTEPKPTQAPLVSPENLPAQDPVDDDGQPFEYTVCGAINSDMVFQRNKYINVYGTGEPGKLVYAEFGGDTRYAECDEMGHWLIQFNPQEANKEGQDLYVYTKAEGKDGGKKFTNILIGDVWIVSGQSNVQVSLEGTLDNNPSFESTISEDDNIRLYNQFFWDASHYWEMDENDNQIRIEPHEEHRYDAAPNTKWWTNSVETAKAFSAVGYYFAKQLADNTDVPIGMIQCVAGGAAIRDFMPPEYYDDKTMDHGLSLFKATDIWNSLMAPFANTNIRGFLWYQGEANESAYDSYTDDLVSFVDMMRKEWGEDLPFYSVQITSHNDQNASWPNIADIRYAQWKALEKIDNYFIVCGMDYGSNALDTDWAHPKNKKHIGDRLAYLALSRIYDPEKFPIDYYGSPVMAKVEVKSGYAYVYFDYVGDGLQTSNGGKDVVGFYSKNAGKLLDAKIVSKNCVKVILEDRAGNSITNQTFSFVYGGFAMADQEKCNLQNSNGIGACAFSYRHKIE